MCLVDSLTYEGSYISYPCGPPKMTECYIRRSFLGVSFFFFFFFPISLLFTSSWVFLHILHILHILLFYYLFFYYYFLLSPWPTAPLYPEAQNLDRHWEMKKRTRK